MSKPRWRKFEEKLAKDLEGTRNRGSGNFWKTPTDVTSKYFTIEAKTTDKKSFSVSLDLWTELCTHAIFLQKLPMLALKIQEFELVVLDKEDLINILKSKKEGKNE